MRGGLTAVIALLGLICLGVISGIGWHIVRRPPRLPGKDDVRLPGDPFGVIPSRDGRWLFVSISNSAGTSGSVAALKRNAGHIELARVVSLPMEPTGMVLTHDGKLLVVAAHDRLVFLDVQRMTSGAGRPVLGSIQQPGVTVDCFYVNVTADDKLLFVSEEHAGAITVIDLERARKTGFRNDAILGIIPVGERTVALTFSPDDKWLYTTSEEAPPEWGWPAECAPEAGGSPEPVRPQGAVVVVDVDKASKSPAEAVVARVPAACAPVRAVISPEGDRLFVAARKSNAIIVFDTAKLLSDGSHAQVGLVPVGQSPAPLAVIDGGTKLLVGNSSRYAVPHVPGTLTVLDTAKLQQGTGAVLGTIPTGVYPREMSVSPDGNTVFLTNTDSGSLQVINVKSLPPLPSNHRVE